MDKHFFFPLEGAIHQHINISTVPLMSILYKEYQRYDYFHVECSVDFMKL